MEQRLYIFCCSDDYVYFVDLIDKCGHDAEDTTMRRPTSLILEKLADPTLVKKHPYQEHIIQAANNIIEDTGRASNSGKHSVESFCIMPKEFSEAEIRTVAEWEMQAAAIRMDLKTAVMKRTTDWTPTTTNKQRKKVTKLQYRITPVEEKNSKLCPNQLFVLVTALNRAQRLKTYATPLYGFCR
ncbi:hypothetical protein Fcan01_22052, partial [Folsomia candida]